MARIEKTVFISYRRTDLPWALAVYQNLTGHGYDVFFDFNSIGAGDFEKIIISNIKARAHFLVILTPTALDRCSNNGDWLRREIETAIDEKRNIVPLFINDFKFGAPSVSAKLTGKLKEFARYNGLTVHHDSFQQSMERLRSDFLTKPLTTDVERLSADVQAVVREHQIAADKELEKIEDIRELVKRGEKDSKKDDKSGAPLPKKKIPWTWVAGGVGILFIVFLLFTFLNKLSIASPEPTQTFKSIPTHTFTPTYTQLPTLTSTITDTPKPSHTPTITLTPTETSTPTDTLTPTPAPVLSVTVGGCGRYPIGTQCSVRVGISWIPVDKSNKICVYVQPAGSRFFPQTNFSYFPDRTGYTVSAWIGDENAKAGQSFTLYVMEMETCSANPSNSVQAEVVTVTR